jgi:uncharacterized repeat protein (TIGR03809 family)
MTWANPLWKSDDVSLRWKSLAERRRQHFVELYKTGRWKRYYTEDAFLAHMREVVRGADEWGRMVETVRGQAGTSRGERPAAK